MRHEPTKQKIEAKRYRPTCARITGRVHRPVVLPSALDAPDPSWLPEPIDEWDRDAEFVAGYASASQAEQ